MDNVRIEDVLRLQDFGLERLDEDRAIVGFAARTEARIARWLDFAKGALLLLMVPDDPESGCFYIYDRSRVVSIFTIAVGDSFTPSLSRSKGGTVGSARTSLRC